MATNNWQANGQEHLTAERPHVGLSLSRHTNSRSISSTARLVKHWGVAEALKVLAGIRQVVFD